MTELDFTTRGLGKVSIPSFEVDTLKPVTGNRQGVIYDARHSVEAVRITFRIAPEVGGAALQMITGLLGRGTLKNPTIREVAIRENLLYGCTTRWTVKRDGDAFALCLSASFVSPDRVKANGYESEIWQYIYELIHEPWFISPNFEDEIFQIDRSNYIMYLKQLEVEPTSRAIIRSFTQVLEGDPYALPTTGTVEEAESLTLDGLRELFTSIVNNSPVIATASGGLKKDRILPHFEKLFGTHARRARSKTHPFVPAEGMQQICEESPGDADQIVLFFSLEDIKSLKRSDFVTIVSLFSSGSQSRLYFKLREENQLAYGHFDYSSYEKRLVTIVAPVLPQKGDEACKIAVDELAAMAQNLRDDEITTFKLEFLNSYVKQLDSPFTTAQVLSLHLARGKDFNPLITITRVLKISKTRVCNILQGIRPFASYVASAPLESEDSEDSGSSSIS